MGYPTDGQKAQADTPDTRHPETSMPSPQHHFNPPRKSGRTGRQARQGEAPRRQGPSRMALEQPDDTPLDQRLSHPQLGPRQMA